MKCPKCGTELPDGASFCGECGTKLEPKASGPSGPTPPADASKEEAPKGWQYNPAVRIALGVVGVLLIVLGVVRIVSGLGGGNGGTRSAPKQSEVKVDDRYINSDGHLMMRAFMELSGQEVIDQLEAGDYTRVVAEDGNVGWRREGGTGAVTGHQGDEAAAPGIDFSDFEPGGGDVPTYYVIAYDDSYHSPAEAMDALCGVEPDARNDYSDEYSFAALSSSTGARFFCQSSYNENTKSVIMFNEASVNDGFFGDYKSYDELYEDVFESADSSGDESLAEDLDKLTTPEPDDAKQDDAKKDDAKQDDAKDAKTDVGKDDAKKDAEKDKTATVKPPAAATKECLDEFGNPTAYAISELSGADLVRLLESQGFVYNEKETGYENADGTFFGVIDEDFEGLTPSEIEALGNDGGTEPILYLLRTAQYKTGREVVKGTVKCVTEDVDMVDDNRGFAVVYGPSMREYLMTVAHSEDDGVFTVSWFSNDAIASGLFNKVTNYGTDGGEDVGSSVSEVWQRLVGTSVGDYVRDHPFE